MLNLPKLYLHTPLWSIRRVHCTHLLDQGQLQQRNPSEQATLLHLSVAFFGSVSVLIKNVFSIALIVYVFWFYGSFYYTIGFLYWSLRPSSSASLCRRRRKSLIFPLSDFPYLDNVARISLSVSTTSRTAV